MTGASPSPGSRAHAGWPEIPDAYGWLLLDRRGDWRLKNPVNARFERIGHAPLREFIGRRYAADVFGRWYFQNGPQRVFAKLAYAPWVVRVEDGLLVDQCGGLFEAREPWLDEEGSVVVSGPRGVALLDDRDLALYCEIAGPALERAGRIARRDVATRFGFDPDPAPRPEKVDAVRQNSL